MNILLIGLTSYEDEDENENEDENPINIFNPSTLQSFNPLTLQPFNPFFKQNAKETNFIEVALNINAAYTERGFLSVFFQLNIIFELNITKKVRYVKIL